MNRRSIATGLLILSMACHTTLAGAEKDGLWIDLKTTDGRPLVASSKGEAVSTVIDVPSAQPSALLYLSYQRRSRGDIETPGKLEIFLGPVTAKEPGEPGVRRLGSFQTESLDRFGAQERWGVVNAGTLAAGKYRLFVKTVGPASTDPTARPVSTNLRRVGVVADVEHGRWRPAVEILDPKTGKSTQEGQLLPEAVRVAAVSCSEVGQLFLGREVLGDSAKPLPFSITLDSHIVTQPVDCVVHGRLLDADGKAIELPTLNVQLQPGELRDIPYPVKAPAYGWYSVEITAEAQGLHNSSQSAFGVLRDPHEGVREDSPFGLSIGDKPQDMQVARLIGVKWRRGIPFTNPADVVHKTGDPLVQKPEDKITLWSQPEIDKARSAVAQWKAVGVSCLGYVNYNLPWNCLGGAVGGWHKNRPADMKQHVDMVYNLIKPLHDEVKYWEIWNEPWVGGWTWRTGTGQDYRDMSRMIWDRIKPEMPDVMLVGGGSTSYNRDVLFAMNSDNAGYVDGVSTHPYGKPDTNHPSFAAIEAALLKKFAHGGGKGGIWATELGTAAYMFDPLPRTEEDLMVARTVAPHYLLAKLGAGQTPIRLFFFASLYGSGNFSGGEHNLWDATGGTPAPRPALVAFSTMTHFLEDAKLLGDIYAAAKGGWALHFVQPDGTSVVVYIQEQPATGDIDPTHASESERAKGEMILPSLDFDVYDYLGRPIGEREGDHLRVPTQVWEARYFVSKKPVEQVRQALLDAHFSDVPSLLVNPRSFDAPLASKPKLRFKVENVLPQKVDATLEVTPPADFTLAQTSVGLKDLQPGEIRWVSFDLTSAKSNDVNRYPITYRTRIGDNVQESTQVVQAAYASYGTPKIDGDLSDWLDVTPVTMVSRGGKDWRQITMDPSQAAALLAKNAPSATRVYRFWTRWDDQNFYAAAIVPASNQDLALPYNGPISTTKNMLFMHDCLQLAFATGGPNPDDLAKGNPLYEKAMATDVDYEFVAALLSNNRAVVDRVKAPGTNEQTYYPLNGSTTPPLGTMTDAKCVVHYDAKAQIYAYEIAIPWSDLGELQQKVSGLKPGESLLTRFAFAVNDTAGPGRTYWTQEAGDLQAGSYGFSPTWGGGARKMGGRILTDWTIRR